MNATPVNAWPLPDFTTAPPDGPAAFQALGTGIENTIKSGAVADFVPVWTSVSSPQPSAPSALTCKWELRDGFCSIAFHALFGASTYGGRGTALFTLPRPAAVGYPEQWLRARISVPSVGAMFGGAQIRGGEALLRLYFPLAVTNSSLGAFQNSDSSGAVATGIPAVPGAVTVQSGGRLMVTGRYAAT